MSKTIKVAFVGAGYMASEHIRAFSGLEGVELAGIFSRTRARAEALASEFGIPQVCDSVAALYEATQADLVVVTVRELAMNEVAVACFAYPWAALLEKPAGYNLEDAESILASAERLERQVFVALNRRAYSSTRQAQASISAADGQRLVVVQDQQDMEAVRLSGESEEIVRSYMFANSIHIIDYLSLFCRGEVANVSSPIAWDAEKPGFVVSTIEFTSGDVGVYQGIWDGPGPWAVSISTPALRAEMRPLETLTLQKRGERKLEQITIDAVDTDFKPGLRYQAEQAIAAVRGAPHALATLAGATESMRLCARIFGLRA